MELLQFRSDGSSNFPQIAVLVLTHFYQNYLSRALPVSSPSCAGQWMAHSLQNGNPITPFVLGIANFFVEEGQLYITCVTEKCLATPQFY